MKTKKMVWSHYNIELGKVKQEVKVCNKLAAKRLKVRPLAELRSV